jgi:hypothetical protein
MTDLPEPLVPAHVDLRDFAYMPLQVNDLLKSSFWIKSKKDPRVAHAAVSLWCQSWHQVPAGSLPDDDEILAELAMCDDAEWGRVRERALKHFVKCADGRFYHRVVSGKAMEAWTAKNAQRDRTRAATQARKAKVTDPDMPRAEERALCRDDQRDGASGDQRDDERDVHQGNRKGIEEKGDEGGVGEGEGFSLNGDDPPPAKRGRSPAASVTFKTWASSAKERGEKLIPEDDTIFAYADEIALPRDFLDLAWFEFRRKYTHEAKDKRQKDWRAHFRDAVRRNWYGLWIAAAGGGDYRLTTAGEQLRRAIEAKRRGE